MKLTDYGINKKATAPIELGRGESNSSSTDSFSTIQTKDVMSKSSPITVNVIKDNASTKVDYDLSTIIPTGANVVKSNVTLYGSNNGAKQYLDTANTLMRRLEGSVKFSDFELGVNVQYELNGKVYKVDETIKVNQTKSVALSVTEVKATLSTPEEIYSHTDNRLDALESRIIYLESVIKQLTNS